MILAVNIPVEVIIIGGGDGKFRLYDYKSNIIVNTTDGFNSPIIDLSIVSGSEDSGFSVIAFG